jgi:hypothetical protein
VALRSKIGIHAETPPLKVLIPRDLHIGNTEFDAVEVGKEVEFEVADCNFKQLDREIIVIGRLRTALKPAPLMPLLSAKTDVELPKVTSTAPSSDEKTVVVGPVEPEKKKTRKLKKPSVSIPNESLQIGIDEGSVGQA